MPERAIDLKRPKLNNEDGSFSTEETITIDSDGRFFNIPTIINGKRVSEDEAIRLFKAGQNQAVGDFDSLDEAVSAARARSDRIGAIRGSDNTGSIATQLITNTQAESDRELLERARLRRARREEEQAPAQDSAKPNDIGFKETATSVALDIGGGLIEIPGALIHGVRDAIQETLDLGAELDQKTADLTGFWPALQITDEAGNVNVKLTNLKGKKSKSAIQLPEGPEQDTKTGQIVESIAQFGAGFLGAKKFTAAAGLLKNSGPITKAAVNGAIADFTAFDGQDGRLADLVAKVPGLGEFVPEFMKTTEDEGELEGRLKNMLEGVGLGVAFDFTLSSLRAFRAQRRAQKALQDVEKEVGKIKNAEEARAAKVEETVKKINGNPSGNRTRKVVSDGPGDFEQWQPNLARINTTDDIKETILELIEKNKGEVDAARRGTVSHATTEAEAAAINAWDALKARNPGQTLSAAESVAARQLWATSGKNVRDAAQAYLASPDAGTQFAFQRSIAVHRAIQAEVMGARAEAGRILDSWKIPAGDSFKRMKEIEDVLALNGGSAKTVDDMARRISVLSDSQVDLLDDAIRSSAHKASDAFGEAWRFSLLSSPKTHFVNAISNTAVMAWDIVETSFAGRLGRLMGDDAAAELIEEAAVKSQAMRTAVVDQLRYLVRHRKFNNMGVAIGKVDAARTRPVSAAAFNLDPDSAVGQSVDVIGRILSVPQDILGGADDFFKGVNFKAELTARAHRIAMDEARLGILPREDIGKRMADLVTEPPNDLWEHARTAAQTRTFTKPPRQGGPVQSVINLRTWMNSGGVPVGHLLLPFINTPANIMKYTFDRTPFGYALLRKELAAGGKEAAVAKAKIALGTSALFLGADMASNGMVTGGGPTSPNERKTLERTGWQPYSVKVGDAWVRYDRFDPLGNFLGMGADFHEILANRGYDDGVDLDLFGSVGMMVGQVGSSLLSETYLTGVSDFVNVLNDPKRYGPNYVRNLLATATVPAGLAEIRRQTDPQMREIASTLDAIKNRTPGLSGDLPKRVDLWGRPQTYQSHVGQVYDALSPFIARKIDPEPIDSELLRLRYFPQMMDRSISVPYQGRNVSVSLRNNPEIYSRMVALAGNEAKVLPGGAGAKDFLNDFVKSSAYERLDDGAEAIPGSKAYAIRRIISASRKAAVAMTYREFRSQLNDLAARQVAREEAERARQEEAAALEAAQALLEQQ